MIGKNSGLPKHSLIKHHNVASAVECAMMCRMAAPFCVSFNIQDKLDASKYRICELNNSKITSVIKLMNKKGYAYYEII